MHSLSHLTTPCFCLIFALAPNYVQSECGKALCTRMLIDTQAIAECDLVPVSNFALEF